MAILLAAIHWVDSTAMVHDVRASLLGWLAALDCKLGELQRRPKGVGARQELPPGHCAAVAAVVERILFAPVRR